MSNRVNEYIRERPSLGAVIFSSYIAVAYLIGVQLREPSRPLTGILTDGGVWFTIALLTFPLGLFYYIISTRS